MLGRVVRLASRARRAAPRSVGRAALGGCLSELEE